MIPCIDHCCNCCRSGVAMAYTSPDRLSPLVSVCPLAKLGRTSPSSPDQRYLRASPSWSPQPLYASHVSLLRCGTASPCPDQGYHTLVPPWPETALKGKRGQLRTSPFDRLPDDVLLKVHTLMPLIISTPGRLISF